MALRKIFKAKMEVTKECRKSQTGNYKAHYLPIHRMLLWYTNLGVNRWLDHAKA